MAIAHARRGGICLSHLSKSYGNLRAVDDVDLALEPGQTVALLGPNGAGKSTTIDMMLGLARPDAGTVTLFGEPPTRAVREGWVSGMLQSGSLIAYLNVRELVTMMASLYPEPLPVEEVLRLTGTLEISKRMTTKLSGGQVQRVRFALALVANAGLMVLDEPTAALDVESRRGFWAAIREVAAGGKTIVFATHYLEEADAYADRVVLMAGGRVVADGPPTEIKSRVGGRTIRATLPDVGPSLLGAIAGVTSVDRHGDTVVLLCNRPDEALRELLGRFPQARDIEVCGAGLEEAFLELTMAGSADQKGGTQ
jgi:ABC-2 type transport system ATP-binding protein